MTDATMCKNWLDSLSEDDILKNVISNHPKEEVNKTHIHYPWYDSVMKCIPYWKQFKVQEIMKTVDERSRAPWIIINLIPAGPGRLFIRSMAVKPEGETINPETGMVETWSLDNGIPNPMVNIAKIPGMEWLCMSIIPPATKIHTDEGSVEFDLPRFYPRDISQVLSEL